MNKHAPAFLALHANCSGKVLASVEAVDEMVNILFTLLSFECFDTLAGPTRSIEEVAPAVQRLARAALRLDDL